MRAMLRPALPAVLAFAALAAAPGPPPVPSPEAAALRGLGLAQLENERTGEAAETFRRLAKLAPDDPLAYADLAVAALRQQKSDEAAAAIAQALARSPGRPDLLAIEGDVLQWSGKGEEALAVYRKAAAAAPDQVAIQYALYRLAVQGPGAGAAAALAESLRALARLRPENLGSSSSRGSRPSPRETARRPPRRSCACASSWGPRRRRPPCRRCSPRSNRTTWPPPGCRPSGWRTCSSPPPRIRRGCTS
jgi:tetratricopeptide (TPR) repeat protein